MQKAKIRVVVDDDDDWRRHRRRTFNLIRKEGRDEGAGKARGIFSGVPPSLPPVAASDLFAVVKTRRTTSPSLKVQE